MIRARAFRACDRFAYTDLWEHERLILLLWANGVPMRCSIVREAILFLEKEPMP